MTGKGKDIFYRIGSAAVLAGLIMVIIGVYYAVVKAGIPYQDPPLELQIQYAVNSGVGDALCKTGFFTVLSGLAFRLLLKLINIHCRQ